MQTQEVAIKPTMKVFMKVDSEMLDEVIVVAYGTAKKSAFTGSASVVKADKLEKRQVSNITNALSGSVAGTNYKQQRPTRNFSHSTYSWYWFYGIQQQSVICSRWNSF